MHLFISYSKKVPAFITTVILILGFEVSLYFVPNLHYLEGGGSFFTYYKKNIAENEKQTFDILLFGDSRSLSINGIKEKEADYTMYNFSLPAAGPRYFKFFLKKYLNHHPNPKLIIWAADPEQFNHTKSKTFNTDKNLWQQYKHRLLNLFTFLESFEQYSGNELLFISREYLPLVMYSYKYRQGLDDLLSGLKLETITTRETYHTKQNRMIEAITSSHNGQINLGDYFMADQKEVEKSYLKYIEALNAQKDFDLSPLADFISYAQNKNIPVLVLNIPRAEGLNDTLYFKLITPEIKKIVSAYANARYLEFPQMDYPVSLFSESIHYNGAGEKQLNSDFKKSIYPEIVSIIKKNEEASHEK
ncbi:MAG TPA: DUF1574 family protein [Leptospiraceae bacterium]|nr:DUF1574 family protein [Leptospiraceae bacterium]HMW03709.1 DUF1574 family protein [Leptospiraceae bacterium]HMX34902.1 DUF1574 family protein [Leptospiraceae bacterium]HMY29689.1 DUF1574 family protein [Leptospiraceae bacterium]HMZ64035.1 DUF1574 family protein [Leptospiraceae bacterium]